MKLIVRLHDDLIGDMDKLPSIKEWYIECLILVLGVSQFNHLSLEDQGSEIDVNIAYFDPIIMLFFV